MHTFLKEKDMKKFMKIMGIAALMTGMTTGAMVQEQEYQQQMSEAKARQEAAQKRIDEAKSNK